MTCFQAVRLGEMNPLLRMSWGDIHRKSRRLAQRIVCHLRSQSERERDTPGSASSTFLRIEVSTTDSGAPLLDRHTRSD